MSNIYFHAAESVSLIKYVMEESGRYACTLTIISKTPEGHETIDHIYLFSDTPLNIGTLKAEPPEVVLTEDQLPF